MKEADHDAVHLAATTELARAVEPEWTELAAPDVANVAAYDADLYVQMRKAAAV